MPNLPITSEEKPAVMPPKPQTEQELQRRTVVSDCRLMLRYAMDESCQIPITLAEDIAKVDAFLIAAEQEPLSEVPLDLIKAAEKSGVSLPVAPATPPKTETLNEVILRVHNALSSLVAPATALSLRATDPDLVWFGMPPIVKRALAGALFFMVWFLICVPKPELPKSKDQPSGQTAQTTSSPSSSSQTTPSPSPRNP